MSVAPVSLGKFSRGVDISKDALDVAIHPGGESFRITNNANGHRALINRLKGSDIAGMVFEATGAYHRLLQQALADSRRRCRLQQPIATQVFQRNRPEARVQDGPTNERSWSAPARRSSRPSEASDMCLPVRWNVSSRLIPCCGPIRGREDRRSWRLRLHARIGVCG